MSGDWPDIGSCGLILHTLSTSNDVSRWGTVQLTVGSSLDSAAAVCSCSCRRAGATAQGSVDLRARSVAGMATSERAGVPNVWIFPNVGRLARHWVMWADSPDIRHRDRCRGRADVWAPMFGLECLGLTVPNVWIFPSVGRLARHPVTPGSSPDIGYAPSWRAQKAVDKNEETRQANG